MMAEYIEREALLAFLEENHTDRDWLVSQYNADWICSWIESRPAADVVEVKHGRWEDVYGGKYQNKRYRCTVCKEKALFKFYQDELLGWHEEQKLSNYCPNCGARMDGE